MSDLIIKQNYACTSVQKSRSQQEILCAQDTNSVYDVFNCIIQQASPAINTATELIGGLLAQKAVDAVTYRQYHDPNKSKFENFVRRNIYEDPETRRANEYQRELTAEIVMGGVEFGAKALAYAYNKVQQAKAQKKIELCLYALLKNYAITGSRGDETGELALKAKLNTLLDQITEKNRKFILNETEGMRPIKVEDIDISILRQAEDENLMEGLSYFLYSIGVEKYHGLEMNEPEKRRLLNYYILLGYSGKASEELFRQNMEKYDQISFDQKSYLRLGRNFLVKSFGVMPQMPDLAAIQSRAQDMAKYDPYDSHRNMVRKFAGFAAGSATTVGGLLAQNPMLVMTGLSLALSQLDLDDNGMENVYNKLRGYGLDETTIEGCFEMSEETKQKSLLEAPEANG